MFLSTYPNFFGHVPCNRTFIFFGLKKNNCLSRVGVKHFSDNPVTSVKPMISIFTFPPSRVPIPFPSAAPYYTVSATASSLAVCQHWVSATNAAPAPAGSTGGKSYCCLIQRGKKSGTRELSSQKKINY